jgi:hypothetical protein
LFSSVKILTRVDFLFILARLKPQEKEKEGSEQFFLTGA